MKYFGSRRPQGFHHTFLYVDEHKDNVRKVEERARRELGMDNSQDSPSEGLRGTFFRVTQQKRLKRNQFQSMFLIVLFPLIIILLLVFICYILTRS